MKSHGQIVHGDGCIDVEDAINAFLLAVNLEISKFERAISTLRKVKESVAADWKDGSLEYNEHARSALVMFERNGVREMELALRAAISVRRGVTVPREGT